MGLLEKKGKFKDTFMIGDELYFEATDAKEIERLTHVMKHDGDVKVSAKVISDEDDYQMLAANIHFYKGKPTLSFDLDTGELTASSPIKEKMLGCDTASFLIGTPKLNTEISTMADGHYGYVFSTGAETLVHIYMDYHAMDIENLFNTICATLNLKE